jgi:DNA-binding transcriptional ArsR family regulator
VPKRLPEPDQVFHALSDPTRRQVIEQLGRGPASVSTLHQNAQMALPSFVQHLSVLEACGLVTSQKTGRIRTYTLQPNAFKPAETWLDTQRRTWERRLDQLEAYLQAADHEGDRP